MWVAMIAILSLVAVACGDSDDSTVDGDESGTTVAETDETTDTGDDSGEPSRVVIAMISSRISSRRWDCPI